MVLCQFNLLIFYSGDRKTCPLSLQLGHHTKIEGESSSYMNDCHIVPIVQIQCHRLDKIKIKSTNRNQKPSLHQKRRHQLRENKANHKLLSKRRSNDGWLLFSWFSTVFLLVSVSSCGEELSSAGGVFSSWPSCWSAWNVYLTFSMFRILSIVCNHLTLPIINMIIRVIYFL
jgi:hypothetical protein